jgi:hypothetical protein
LADRAADTAVHSSQGLASPRRRGLVGLRRDRE